MDATSNPASRHHCSGDARITVVAALVVWASRSLRGSPVSRNLKVTASSLDHLLPSRATLFDLVRTPMKIRIAIPTGFLLLAAPERF